MAVIIDDSHKPICPLCGKLGILVHPRKADHDEVMFIVSFGPNGEPVAWRCVDCKIWLQERTLQPDGLLCRYCDAPISRYEEGGFWRYSCSCCMMNWYEKVDDPEHTPRSTPQYFAKKVSSQETEPMPRSAAPCPYCGRGTVIVRTNDAGSHIFWCTSCNSSVVSLLRTYTDEPVEDQNFTIFPGTPLCPTCRVLATKMQATWLDIPKDGKTYVIEHVPGTVAAVYAWICEKCSTWIPLDQVSKEPVLGVESEDSESESVVAEQECYVGDKAAWDLVQYIRDTEELLYDIMLRTAVPNHMRTAFQVHHAMGQHLRAKWGSNDKMK